MSVTSEMHARVHMNMQALDVLFALNNHPRYVCEAGNILLSAGYSPKAIKGILYCHFGYAFWISTCTDSVTMDTHINGRMIPKTIKDMEVPAYTMSIFYDPKKNIWKIRD